MKCKCCRVDEARRNRLCNACSLYERRTGRLPSAKVLYRRDQDRKRRREVGAGWLVKFDKNLLLRLLELSDESRTEGAA